MKTKKSYAVILVKVLFRYEQIYMQIHIFFLSPYSFAKSHSRRIVILVSAVTYTRTIMLPLYLYLLPHPHRVCARVRVQESLPLRTLYKIPYERVLFFSFFFGVTSKNWLLQVGRFHVTVCFATACPCNRFFSFLLDSAAVVGAIDNLTYDAICNSAPVFRQIYTSFFLFLVTSSSSIFNIYNFSSVECRVSTVYPQVLGNYPIPSET